MSGRLHTEQTGAVLRVRIDAAPGNLFTPEMTAQLTASLLAPPEGVHVVHLCAAGDVFCVGRAPFRDSVDELRADVEGLVGLNRALSESPAVTVTEVQGDAAGFGAGLVALSDVAIASPQARLSFPEVDAGFAPALVLSWLVPMVGRQAAFWLTATGVKLPASEAREFGLLSYVADSADGLQAAVARSIDLLLSKPPSVHREIKRLMRLYAGLPDGALAAVATERFSFESLRRTLAG